MCTPGVLGSQKRASYPLSWSYPELLPVHVGASHESASFRRAVRPLNVKPSLPIQFIYSDFPTLFPCQAKLFPVGTLTYEEQAKCVRAEVVTAPTASAQLALCSLPRASPYPKKSVLWPQVTIPEKDTNFFCVPTSCSQSWSERTQSGRAKEKGCPRWQAACWYAVRMQLCLSPRPLGGIHESSLGGSGPGLLGKARGNMRPPST